MFKDFLSKEERKEFSNKGWAKVKREDFFAYLEMEQVVLDSLIKRYETSKMGNPIILKEIEKQEKFLEILNKYYYEVIVPNKKAGDNFDIIKKELAKEIKSYKKIQKEVKKL